MTDSGQCAPSHTFSKRKAEEKELRINSPGALGRSDWKLFPTIPCSHGWQHWFFSSVDRQGLTNRAVSPSHLSLQTGHLVAPLPCLRIETEQERIQPVIDLLETCVGACTTSLPVFEFSAALNSRPVPNAVECLTIKGKC